MKEDNIIFQNFLAECLKDYSTQKEQRLGQFLFNKVAEADPDLANKITGSSKDPFYNNKNIKVFLDYVMEEWAKK